VLRTERPEGKWWDSFSVTISKFFALRPSIALPPHIADIFQTMAGWLIKNTFADVADRACAIAAYRRNNEEVRDTIPAERLLVFNVAQGWAPLCRFLETAEPATPFPRSHPQDEFGRISAASQPNLKFTFWTSIARLGAFSADRVLFNFLRRSSGCSNT
jgi:hypothetical protein